jgi:hypothetical protein
VARMVGDLVASSPTKNARPVRSAPEPRHR